MRTASAAALAAAILAASAPVRAQVSGAPAPGPAPSVDPMADLSRYERESLAAALRELDAEVDPAPEGKILEAVDVVRREVIEPRDLPTLPPLSDAFETISNTIHATSRPSVIRREVLLRVGAPYRRELAEETARNLRDIPQLSLVLVVPVRATDPTKVRLLVVTKDIWSLRPNFSARVAGGTLERLVFQPAEENLAGTHQSLGGTFLMDPRTISFGGRYYIPRIDDSRIAGRLEAGVIVNQESGEREGSFGTFAYGQPLYSVDAEWSWIASVRWRKEITRRLIGSRIDVYDAPETAAEEGIPNRFATDVVLGNLSVTRSFGRDAKLDVTLGAEVGRRVYRPFGLEAENPVAVDSFVASELPVSDQRIGPYAQIHAYENRYLETFDLDTLALQEAYQLGPELYLKAYPVLEALNSSRTFLSVSASASWTAPLGNGVARVFVESLNEFDDTRVYDGLFGAGGTVVSPSLPIGRLVFDARGLARYRNYLNKKTFVGGDTRLRGYPSSAFRGDDAIVANLEYRTAPVQVFSAQLAAVGFFDAGDAFDAGEPIETKKSAGFGIRTLFPMLDRAVFRLDWGFPLDPEFAPPSAIPGDIVVTFKQAFPVPSVPTSTDQF